MITVGIPLTNYSNKNGWIDLVTHIHGKDSEVVNLNPWIGTPGGECNEELLPDNVDIIIFDGGADIHPMLYREPKHITTSSNILRDWTELIIFQHYLKLPTKFAGICRGQQFLNVAMGGTLIQDLFTMRMQHNKFHLNDIMPETKFAKFIGRKDLRVNSLHHQAVRELGRNLCVTMTDMPYATIEGIESKKGDKIRAVQSHPEYNTGRYDNRIEVMKWLLRKEDENE